MWPLDELRKTLAALYYTQSTIIDLLIRSGFQPGNFPLEGKAGVLWTLILKELEQREKVRVLVMKALEDYPENPVLLIYREYTAVARFTERVGAPPVKSAYAGEVPVWKGTPSKPQLEKLMGNQSTLLPISFLEVGMQKAASVARLVTPEGVGTGFLISDQHILLTNNHVFENAVTAGKSKAQFNYQLLPGGLPALKEEFEVDNSFFHTSVDHDWSIVKLKGNPAATYKFLPLKRASVKKDDFVNIIQHPGGEHKQIAMYHNLLTFVNDDIIQYLTDTLPGSSGSPVFNSQWEVVALHHSGGWLEEPGLPTEVLRNEGIHINRVLDDLAALNIVL